MNWVQIDVTPIVQRWGAYGVILIAVALFIWKWVLPRIDAWLDQRRQDRSMEREERRKRDERFVEMIDSNLKESQKDREEERDRFLAFVENTLKPHTEALNTLSKKVDERLK